MGMSDILPSAIIIKDNMRKDIMLYVFAAQVSVSTLGIALISILAGMAKDTAYGISISQYLMEDRPFIFKHKVNIILQLIIIIFSYIFLALDGYNFLICTFFVSIIIIAMMVWDVFSIFYGSEHIKEEIYEYFIEIFSVSKYKKNDKRITLIRGLKKDTLISIDIGNSVVLKENLDMFNSILSRLPLNSNDKNINKILNQFEYDLSDIFNKILKEGDINKILIALENMECIYKKCNEINKNTRNKNIKIHLSILDIVSKYFFVGVTKIISLESSDYLILFRLEEYLYDNLEFKEVKDNIVLTNNTYLNVYSEKIYYEILNKGSEYGNSKKLFEIKKKLYTTIKSVISHNSFDEFKEEKIKQLYIQLYKYTKVLIDNGENQVLKETLFKTIDKLEYKYSKKDIEYVFIILIYLHYITNVDLLVCERLKNDAKELIKSNIKKIKYFLSSQYSFNIDKKFVCKAKCILGEWEIMSTDEKKYFIMDNGIEEFIIFYILKKNWDIDKLTNQLRILVDGEDIYIYMDIYKNRDVIKKYILFINTFFDENITEEQAEDKIDILKSSIINLCKEYEIGRYKEIKTEENFKEIKKQIRDLCLRDIKDKLQNFNNAESSRKIINTKRPLLDLEISMDFLNSIGFNNSIISLYNTNLIEMIIEVVKEKLLKIIISIDDQEMINKFFDLKQTIDLDTIIGDISLFHRPEQVRKFEFREFEKDKFKIKDQYCNDCMIAIDSKKFYFKVNDISVKIENVNINQINIEPNQKGEYAYNVRDDTDLLFDEDELKEYILNCKRRILIEADIDYGFTEDIVGIGIFI